MGLLFWVLAVPIALAALALLSWFRALRQRPLSLAGQHVLVTGGSEGLGLEFAKLCAARGAHVSLLARGQKKLEAAQKEVQKARRGNYETVQVLTCDVSKSDAVQKAVNQAVLSLGPVDLLVANAGLSVPKLFSELSEDEFRVMSEVNLFGAANAARAVLPMMQKQRSGRLVFVASAMSLTAFAGFTGYCASKWGVRGLAECLESECLPHNVAVHIYYATTMKTPGLEAENRVKPKVTHELESMGDSIDASSAAKILMAGLDQRQFSITADAGAELMLMGSLLSPYHNFFLRLLVAPIIAPVAALWRWHTRRLACKYIQ